MVRKLATTLDLGATSESEMELLMGDSPIKREINDIVKKSRAAAKQETCYYCGKEVSSFCNSHSVPAFCLRNISEDGNVLTLNALIDNPLFDREKGIKKAGTFQLICRDCDSKIFAEYENPDNYISKPSPKMIAQMALKNNLKLISKRLIEIEMYRIGQEAAGRKSEYFDVKTEISEIDLKEYIAGYQKAKKAIERDRSSEYYVCFYERLPYVVPIAFQCSVALVFDFEGNIINDIYNRSSEYEIKNINISILPMKNDSIILMFWDDGDTRYRKFYKQFRKLPLDDKLAALTFIMFAYSEDMYFSKEIQDDVKSSEQLCNVGRSTEEIFSITRFFDPYRTLKESYDLSKRHSIPNLLSSQYKLR